MASGNLYTFPNNFRANKILIAARYSGADVQVPSDFKFGETNKSEQFLKKFPLGKVPSFEDIDGKCLSESNAIAHYVGNKQLRGQNDYDQSLIQQWIAYTESVILPAMCTWVFPCLGIIQYNKQTTERAKEDVKQALNRLNDYLLTRTYLVSERITQADITMCCTLVPLYEHVLDLNFRQAFANVNRWFITLVNQPEFKTVLGDVKLCEKMAQFNAQKFAELQGKSGKGNEKKKEKQKQEKPKQEKKQSKKAADDDDEEDDKPEEPKKKDPFANFPAGSFNMDDFKRKYSNEEPTESVPYFWEKFDKENFSIWFCEYKYPTELSKLFMSSNLIDGMYQRIDKLRKNAFASMVLSGVDNDNQISGIWVWRGHDLAFTLSPDWSVDYESYSWTKLDNNSPETKEKVDKYLSWSPGDYCGKIFVECIIFK